MPTTPESRIKIQVNNLTKRFGDLTVLDGINFNIKEGELLAIVGPTGCGKTTFLNTLSKLMPATEGEILIDGEEANPKKHNISYVFQEPTCLPWRTVRENVAYGMEVKGVGKEEREARATQIMDLVGLRRPVPQPGFSQYDAAYRRFEGVRRESRSAADGRTVWTARRQAAFLP